MRDNRGAGQFGGAHLNMRVLELSFDVDQDGVFSSGFNWTPYSIFSVDPDVREFGWSFPTPFFQLGELYTPRGTYGTFALGREVLGVSVGVHFGVHKDNPTNGMAASEKVHPRFDHQGNVIGTVIEEHLPHSKHGWVYRQALLRDSGLRHDFPLSPLASWHANDLGGAEGVEAVDEGDADLDFGGLAVEVSYRYAFARGLQAPHLRLDPASDVISGPSLPG